MERTIYALVNEGAKILEEGIALRAVDIDIIYLNGYGFPALLVETSKSSISNVTLNSALLFSVVCISRFQCEPDENILCIV